MPYMVRYVHTLHAHMKILIRLYVSNIYFLILPRHDKAAKLKCAYIQISLYLHIFSWNLSEFIVNKQKLTYTSEVFSNKQKKTEKNKTIN